MAQDWRPLTNRPQVKWKEFGDGQANGMEGWRRMSAEILVAFVRLFSVCMCKCMYVCVSMCVLCTRKAKDTQVHTHTDKQVRQTLNKFVKPT